MGYLRSPDLKRFFSATGITHAFRIRETDERFFLVEPYKSRGTRRSVEQLSLFPVSPEGEAAPQRTPPEAVVEESPKSARLLLRTEATGAPAGSLKETTKRPAEKSRQKSAAVPKKAKHVSKTPAAPPPLITPPSPRIAADRKPDAPVAKKTAAAKKATATPPSKPATPFSKPVTGEKADAGIARAAAAPPSPPSPAAEAPVKITFFPEEDAALLASAATIDRKQITPLQDLFLHRQALLLSFSPGFDRLLSLAAAHNVEPLDYQLATVRHVLKNLRGRALLCDEVGLGKTIEACLVMLEYMLRGLVRRVLILVPPSLVEQWQQELQSKFNLDFVAYDAPAFKAAANPWAEFDRIIASLDTAKREPHRKQVLESSYDLVIVDEAHHLKNHLTQAYQLVGLLKKKYILLLTATPVENNLEELFNLITLLQPGQLETASSFKRKYITRGDPLKPKNTEALRQLVQEVMVRNRRSQTGVITSRRRAEVIEVTLSPDEMAFYRRLTAFVREHYFSGEGESAGSAGRFTLKTLQREVGSSIEAVIPTLEKMSANPNHPAPQRRLFHALAEQARAVTGRKKAEALLALLAGIPEKVIVFTGFMQTQSFLVERLRAHGLSVAELHGGMNRQQKEEELRLFAGEAKVLVSTETGSEGRNLHFCNVMINYDLPWNPMRIEQRIGRIHRLGQTKDVYIYNLSAAKTVEAYILELLDAKINMFQLVVGELDMILGNLKEKRSFEDIVMDVWSRAADEEEVEAGMEELGRKLAAAKEHYLAVKEIDDRLLGELIPADE
ncbi:MAG: SNF2-related protein [Bacillota bacterium]